MNSTKLLLPLAVCLVLTGCPPGGGGAPVTDHSTIIGDQEKDTPASGSENQAKPETYLIKPGDTLHAIAWQHDIYFLDLARWNNLQPPYVIYAGKTMRLTPPREMSAKAPAGTKADRKNIPSPPLGTRNTEQPRQAATATGPIAWSWPVNRAGGVRDKGQGRLLLGTPEGQPVRAAAAGTIVYSGSGIRGHGKLIIIKHNDEFLSAYGNNSSLLVTEGELVESRQKIALSGVAPGEEPALYFEIRRYGKRVDTRGYLP